MKSGTEQKLKFKQLQRRFDLALWQARGLLDTLWNFASHNCPAGDIGRFSDDEIATGIDWRGIAEELVITLVETRWIDRSDSHRLIIHDWPDHCEDNVHKFLARRISVFADGTIPSMSRLSKDERAQIEPQYKDRYGSKSLKAGRISGRTENAHKTHKNAPASPRLAAPGLTSPSPTIPGQTCAIPGAADAAGMELPAVLTEDPFPPSWLEWLSYRRSRRLSMRPETLRKQLRDLAPLGPAAAAKCVDLSIRNGWQGLFPEKIAAEQKRARDPNGNAEFLQSYLNEEDHG